MCRNMIQGRGVPGQIGLNQRSGNSAVLNEPTVFPCSYVHQQLVPGLVTNHSKCTGAGTDYKVAMTGHLALDLVEHRHSVVVY